MDAYNLNTDAFDQFDKAYDAYRATMKDLSAEVKAKIPKKYHHSVDVEPRVTKPTRPNDIMILTTEELKTMLRMIGLKVTGKKIELQQRLVIKLFPDYWVCANCGDLINCIYQQIYCLHDKEYTKEETICQCCHDDLKEQYKKEGWECDDWLDDSDDETDDTVSVSTDNSKTEDMVEQLSGSGISVFKLC